MSVLRRTARALALTSRDAGVSGGRVRRLNLSAFDNDKVKKLTPEELARQAAEMEELSVFRAVGGLVAACAGGAAVFAVGAAATLGVSSLAASAIGRTVQTNAKVRAQRETLEAEYATVTGWGFGARRRRKELREAIDALVET
jgi:hypothetical protein|mmetsp:Transcript_3504/g.12631  ORF Transcript_3504/g.12631 Transcript_3504/m.12631 type:complete len:143 (+) Transcript_3504:2662-3090(+)